jgi:hypothetical protein
VRHHDFRLCEFRLAAQRPALRCGGEDDVPRSKLNFQADNCGLREGKLSGRAAGNAWFLM